MDHSRRSHLDVVQSMTDAKATLRTSHDLSFEAARRDTNNDIPIWAWEKVLTDKCQARLGEMAAAVDDEANIEYESRLTDKCWEKYEVVISREGKFFME